MPKIAPMWEEPLDGDTFAKMIVSGCHNIIIHQEELNTTNVFPIPDGDTGANMASAGKHMISALQKEKKGSPLGTRALAVAKACLMGGRGNSGTLLTYLFNQISKELEGKETISVPEFAKVMKKVGGMIEKSMEYPQEGTIITVARDSMRDKNVLKKDRNLEALMTAWHKSAAEKLTLTPEQLVVNGVHVLKTHFKGKVVVDSGAKGFVLMVEGFERAVKGDPIDSGEECEVATVDLGLVDESAPEIRLSSLDVSGELDGQIEIPDNRYCTECIFEIKPEITIDKVRDGFGSYGDSMVPIIAGNLCKLHIHSNVPGKVFTAAQKMSPQPQLIKEKVECMKTQVLCNQWEPFAKQSSKPRGKKRKVHIILHSSNDMPEQMRRKLDMGMINTIVNIKGMGEATAKGSVSSDEFFTIMRHTDPVCLTAGATVMNQLNAVREGLKKAKEVLYLTMPAELSKATFNNWNRMLIMLTEKEKKRITYCDLKSVGPCTFFLALQAHRMAEMGMGSEEIADELVKMRNVPNKTGFYVCAPTLKYLLRGGRVSTGKAFVAGTLLNAKLILTCEPKLGKLVPHAKSIGPGSYGRAKSKIFKLLRKAIPRDADVSFGIIHTGRPDKYRQYEAKLEKMFPNCRQIYFTILAPDIGCHGGPNGMGIGWFIHDGDA